MAEILRLNESAEAPVTPALPHNIEAEAALLGALMIDNRLVEDVQLKLRSDHYFEPLHGRIYDSILRMTDKNMVANPVTLRPMFEADEAMSEQLGNLYRDWCGAHGQDAKAYFAFKCTAKSGGAPPVATASGKG